MEIDNRLKIQYDSMSSEESREITSFIEGLPLAVENNRRGESNILKVSLIEPDSSFFVMAPLDVYVSYSAFANLDPCKYNTALHNHNIIPHNLEGRNDTCGFLVQFKDSPYTALYLLTAPVITINEAQ